MQVDARTLFSSVTMRIVDWRCLGHGPEPFGGEEWNDAPEIVVVRRGAFVRRVGGRDLLVDPGSVAFHDPDQEYRVRHPLGGDACSAFRLTHAAAAELLDPAGPGRDESGPRPVRFPRALAPLDGRAFLLHRMAVRAAQDPAATPVEVEERAARFLRAALASAAGSELRARDRAPRTRHAAEYAARAREIVARRYREPLTLGSIARDVGCSPFHLHRMVTAVAGIPLHRLIVRLRLRDALERLIATRDSVSAIAYATGFASHSHLTDVFRREYGCPPSAVRGRTARAAVRRAPDLAPPYIPAP